VARALLGRWYKCLGCGGRLREILPKAETITVRGLQYVFTTKVEQILGFLADDTGRC
jgi:hypothetical protein